MEKDEALFAAIKLSVMTAQDEDLTFKLRTDGVPTFELRPDEMPDADPIKLELGAIAPQPWR